MALLHLGGSFYISSAAVKLMLPADSSRGVRLRQRWKREGFPVLPMHLGNLGHRTIILTTDGELVTAAMPPDRIAEQCRDDA